MAGTTALVVGAVAGVAGAIGSRKSAKEAQKGMEGQSAADRAFMAKQAAQAREDVLNLFPRSLQMRGAGTEQAVDVLGRALPQQTSLIQQGSMNAQNQLIGGSKQFENAIMGLPVDRSGLQAKQLDVDTDWLEKIKPSDMLTGRNPEAGKMTAEEAAASKAWHDSITPEQQKIKDEQGIKAFRATLTPEQIALRDAAQANLEKRGLAGSRLEGDFRGGSFDVGQLVDYKTGGGKKQQAVPSYGLGGLPGLNGYGALNGNQTVTPSATTGTTATGTRHRGGKGGVAGGRRGGGRNRLN